MAPRWRCWVVAGGAFFVTVAGSKLGAAAERSTPYWLVGLDLSYGKRWETQTLRDGHVRSGDAARADPLATPSMALHVARLFEWGGLLGVTVRVPPFLWAGQWAIGAGVGVEKRIASRSWYLHGAASFGYAGIAYPFDGVGVTYRGPWARGELGVRYRVLEDMWATALETRASGFESKLSGAFDLFLALSVGIDAVGARYGDLSGAELTAGERGLRVGPDASVGVDFLL